MNSGIYKIIHVKTGRFYVGSTNDFIRRKRDHWRQLRAGVHANDKLQSSWNTHGEAEFAFEIIEPCELDKRIALEQEWLDRGEWYYNLSKSADNIQHTVETRAKISAKQKQRYRTYNGKSIQDMVDVSTSGASFFLVHQRLKRGWDIERAVSTPPCTKHRAGGDKRYMVEGVPTSLADLARLADVAPSLMLRWLERLTVEQALDHAAVVRSKRKK